MTGVSKKKERFFYFLIIAFEKILISSYPNKKFSTSHAIISQLYSRSFSIINKVLFYKYLSYSV